MAAQTLGISEDMIRVTHVDTVVSANTAITAMSISSEFVCRVRGNRVIVHLAISYNASCNFLTQPWILLKPKVRPSQNSSAFT